MELEDKISLCQNLATIILTRLLVDVDTDITKDDVDHTETILRKGVSTFGHNDTIIRVTGICHQCAHIHNDQMLPYINGNKNLRTIKKAFEASTWLYVDIVVFENKVVCYYYTDEHGSKQQISFTVLANRSKNKVFGVGESIEDYGFNFHKDYLQKLFGCMLGKPELYAYLNAVTEHGVTNESILQATKDLYKVVATSLLSKFKNGPDSDYFTFLNRLFTNIHRDFVQETYFKIKRTKGKIIELDYKSLFTLLRFIEIDVSIDEELTPTIRIIDTNHGRLVFLVSMEQEDCETSPNGKKYNVQLKVGDAVSYVIKKWSDHE